MSLSSQYEITLINSTQQFLQLKQEWTELLASSSYANIFLTWEWCYTWWRYYGSNSELWLLVAQDQEGTIVGLAPLYYHKGNLGIIGDNEICPDHLDFIAQRDKEQTVFASFVDTLDKTGKSWNQFEIEALQDKSLLLPLLRQRGRGFYAEEPGAVSPYIELAQDWETYYQSLSKNTRRNIRRHRRKLEKLYPNQVIFRQTTKVESLSRDMDSLIRLHTKSWQDRGEPGVFASLDFEAFHRDFAVSALKHNWLRLYILEVAGRDVSVQYGFRYGDTAFEYQSAYDPDWSRFRVGNVLTGYVIKQCIAERVHKVDLLRGAEPYKYQWAKSEYCDRHVRVCSNYPRAKMLWIISTLGRQAKKVYRRVLPSKLRKTLRHLWN